MTAIRNLGTVIVDDLRVRFLRESFDEIGRRESLIDVGCGARPFRALYSDHVEFSVGTDWPKSLHDSTRVQVYSNAIALPFADESFDIILCTEVMEHVADPARMLADFCRILRPEGLLILTTPFLVPIHEAPHDYFRYTRYGLESLLKNSGFEVRRLRPFGGLVGVLIESLVRLQLKAWTALSTALRWKSLAGPWNPLVFLLALIPQKIYASLFPVFSQSRLTRRLVDATTYGTIGYGTLAAKRRAPR